MNYLKTRTNSCKDVMLYEKQIESLTLNSTFMYIICHAHNTFVFFNAMFKALHARYVITCII